jgi:uncharacterized protein
MEMIPEAFIQYLVHFHGDRDYFECHEILEDFWKETDPGNKNSVLVGFIQLAVSNYHYRRGNFSGALRTLEKSAKILSAEKESCEDFAINHPKLMKLIMEQRDAIQTQNPYKSRNLPISNKNLINKCQRECEKQGVVWGGKSNLLDESLINRHSIRDRTNVILERKNALDKRKNNQ